MTDMFFYTGRAEDLSAVSKLSDEIFQGAEVFHPSESFEKNGFFILCVKDDIPMGYIAFSIALDEAELLSLGVIERYRNTGVGRALIKEGMNELILRGVKNIYLEVRESNRNAIKLYLSFGFEERGIRNNYYKNPAENAVIMKKEII